VPYIKTRNIIVIGASAGGFEAIKRLVASLPADLPVSIFVVWHMSPSVRGVLPQVLNRFNSMLAEHAIDNEPIVPGRIYIAPPDHHLLVEPGRVRVTHGPKENRFRPAVDPLFRSAAYAYGSQVIGIVLSGALDDGTAGLWTVKQRGGLAIVQDPLDAEVPSMPQNALNQVKVDYSVPVAQMGELLVRLCQEEVPDASKVDTERKNDEKLELEVRIAAEENTLDDNIMKFGELAPFTCPECHGVLSVLRDGNLRRFRCHTGHAYSSDTLLASITEKIEDSLWSAIRGVEESMMLLNHMGDHFAEANHPRLAALYFQKARDAEARAEKVREVVIEHEQLSSDGLREQTEE
jgi:two-component system, chemotaxis family, protein-glutamate methylesterase/glutaminase